MVSVCFGLGWLSLFGVLVDVAVGSGLFCVFFACLRGG